MGRLYTQECIGLVLTPLVEHSTLLEWPSGTELRFATSAERDLRVSLCPEDTNDVVIFRAYVLERYTVHKTKIKIFVPSLNVVAIVPGNNPGDYVHLVAPPEGGDLQVVRANQQIVEATGAETLQVTDLEPTASEVSKKRSKERAVAQSERHKAS